MDNLILIWDIIDLANFEKQDLGLLSINQEKAFDRVDHKYLFKTLETFGIGKAFIFLDPVILLRGFCHVKGRRWTQSAS